MPGRPRRGLARFDSQIQEPHFFDSLEVRLLCGQLDGHFSGSLPGFVVRASEAARSESIAEMDHADYGTKMFSQETTGTPHRSFRSGCQTIRAEYASARRRNSTRG